MKILVTGNAGSGKSSFGRRLSEVLSIPLYSLDSIVWQENWSETPREEREARIKEITARNEWIIEGVSKQAFHDANKAYFLDIPTYRCRINILKRFFKNGLKTRPELPPNCPEYIGVFKALHVTTLFDKFTKPWLLSSLRTGKVVRIQSYSELNKHFKPPQF